VGAVVGGRHLVGMFPFGPACACYGPDAERAELTEGEDPVGEAVKGFLGPAQFRALRSDQRERPAGAGPAELGRTGHGRLNDEAFVVTTEQARTASRPPRPAASSRAGSVPNRCCRVARSDAAFAPPGRSVFAHGQAQPPHPGRTDWTSPDIQPPQPPSRRPYAVRPLASELAADCNALHKIMFDARKRQRVRLMASGHIGTVS
jgi:hypothetical protein